VAAPPAAPHVRAVVFDVGETLIDETTEYGSWRTGSGSHAIPSPPCSARSSPVARATGRPSSTFGSVRPRNGADPQHRGAHPAQRRPRVGGLDRPGRSPASMPWSRAWPGGAMPAARSGCNAMRRIEASVQPRRWTPSPAATSLPSPTPKPPNGCWCSGAGGPAGSPMAPRAGRVDIRPLLLVTVDLDCLLGRAQCEL
jgi:hypothetical protein